MSTTPRTDAAIINVAGLAGEELGEFVDVEFAQQLEKELNEKPTKRELFAALAMQAFITSSMQPNVAAFLQAHNLLGPSPHAKAAVECADALLAELEKGQQ